MVNLPSFVSIKSWYCHEFCRECDVILMVCCGRKKIESCSYRLIPYSLVSSNISEEPAASVFEVEYFSLEDGKGTIVPPLRVLLCPTLSVLLCPH